MAEDSLTGSLLVAAPGLLDPNFRRTVVLVTHHEPEEGAAGLVLNRPSESLVSDAVPDLEPLVGADAAVFVGGPVQQNAGVVLAELGDADVAATPVLEDVGLLTDMEDVGAVEGAVRRARVFAGYAGWGPGQLEAELEREDWIVEPASPDDAFSDDPDDLWSEVLRRKGGHYALLARMPDDPSVN